MTQDNREKPERTIQDVLKEINDNLELIIRTQKEMAQTLDDYIEHKKKMIEEYKKDKVSISGILKNGYFL